jgi:hypothetical protein
MENLIEAISKRQAVVVWNPFEDNDTLTRSEFLVLVKIKGYTQIHLEGNWITAYQEGVKIFGNESLKYQIAEVKSKDRSIYTAIQKEEMQSSMIRKSA